MHPDQQVVTGEAVALDIRLAGMGSRGVAALIDYAIVTIVEIALLILIVVTNMAHLLSSTGSGSSDTVSVEILVAVVGVTLGYPVILETLWRGRTVGKAVMGLRVVRDDGGPIRFRHAFVRGIVGVIVEKPGVLLTIPALIAMNVTSSHKRVGDLMAGTIVLQQRVPGTIETPVHMPPALAAWAAGLELSAVDDDLALRLRQFLGRASGLTPAVRAGLEQQLCGEVVARVGPPPAGTPPWALLAAVLAERRRRAFGQYSGAQPPVQLSVSPVGEAPPPTSGFAAPG